MIESIRLIDRSFKLTNLLARRINLLPLSSVVMSCPCVAIVRMACLATWSTSSSVRLWYFSAMILGIYTCVMTSAISVPRMASRMRLSDSVVAISVSRSLSMMACARSVGVGSPSTSMVCLRSVPLVGLSSAASSGASSSRLVLNVQRGAMTCSISREAEMAFRKSLTAIVTSSCAASGQGIRLMNCACVLPSQSRVQRPIISTISVSDERMPMVMQHSHHAQSKPSLAVPSAIRMSSASREFIRCR